MGQKTFHPVFALPRVLEHGGENVLPAIRSSPRAGNIVRHNMTHKQDTFTPELGW